MKKIAKDSLIAISILIVLIFIYGLINLTKEYVSNNVEAKITSNDTNQNKVSRKDNEVVENKIVEEKEENPTKWKGHDLGEYKFILENEDYAVVVRDIDVVQDTIRFTYTFINESGDDNSGIWNFKCTPYQNGISLDSNKEYQSHYYKCGNEQTSIRSGYSMDGCWELIPIGDKSEIECDMGIGFFNETDLFKINPTTMEWTIEKK